MSGMLFGALFQGARPLVEVHNGVKMIGMPFSAFLILLIAGIIAAFVIHYLFRYRCLKGFDGFLAQWVVGWFGAWLGAPVLGHWWFQIRHVYIIPVLLGAFVAVFIVTAGWKALVLACASKQA